MRGTLNIVLFVSHLMMGSSAYGMSRKQWKKELASRCCTADVCLCQSVNQVYNNKMANMFFFLLLGGCVIKSWM